jgi:hypothetical protein
MTLMRAKNLIMNEFTPIISELQAEIKMLKISQKLLE